MRPPVPDYFLSASRPPLCLQLSPPAISLHATFSTKSKHLLPHPSKKREEMLGWVPIVGRLMALQRCPCASLRNLWIRCGKRDTAHASKWRIVTQGGYPKLSSSPTLVLRRWKQKAEEPEGDVVAEAEVRGVQLLPLQIGKGLWAEEGKRPLQAGDSKENRVSPRPPQSNTALPRPWYEPSETQFRLLISRTVKSHLYCLKPLCGNLLEWQQTPIVSLPGYELPTHTTGPTHHGAASSLSISPAGLHAWRTRLSPCCPRSRGGRMADFQNECNSRN